MKNIIKIQTFDSWTKILDYRKVSIMDSHRLVTLIEVIMFIASFFFVATHARTTNFHFTWGKPITVQSQVFISKIARIITLIEQDCSSLASHIVPLSAGQLPVYRKPFPPIEIWAISELQHAGRLRLTFRLHLTRARLCSILLPARVHVGWILTVLP